MDKPNTQENRSLSALFIPVAIIFGILVFTWISGLGEEDPADAPYNRCMEAALGPWLEVRRNQVPDTVYSRAIRTCDHLDPGYQRNQPGNP